MNASNLSTEITAIIGELTNVLKNPIDFGSITILINFRSGIADRFCITKQEAFLLKQSKDK